MASVANFVQKILRHHAPMIRFRYGLNGSDSADHHASEEKKSATVGASSPSKVSQKSAPLEFSQTPTKYRRRPLTQDEIDLVTVGGTF